MDINTFTRPESGFLGTFFIWHDPPVKIVCLKEYGPKEWYYQWPHNKSKLSKIPFNVQKIVKMLIKSDWLIPEIDNDKEYTVQRALGLVAGRIYYMPEEVRKEIKEVLI